MITNPQNSILGHSGGSCDILFIDVVEWDKNYITPTQSECYHFWPWHSKHDTPVVPPLKSDP